MPTTANKHMLYRGHIDGGVRRGARWGLGGLGMGKEAFWEIMLHDVPILPDRSCIIMSFIRARNRYHKYGFKNMAVLLALSPGCETIPIHLLHIPLTYLHNLSPPIWWLLFLRVSIPMSENVAYIFFIC